MYITHMWKANVRYQQYLLYITNQKVLNNAVKHFRWSSPLEWIPVQPIGRPVFMFNESWCMSMHKVNSIFFTNGAPFY